MEFVNPFVLEKQEYKRDLNVRKQYVEDTALYVSKMRDRPLDQCRDFVIKHLKPGGRFEFKDPTVYYLERQENGDRQKKAGKMSEYINNSIKRNHLIAPTFTTYLSAAEKQSLLVDYIDANVAARGVAKKAMFKAKIEGNKLVETMKEIEQKYKKINNNSISGAHVSPSTPLYNPTAHSTLTSCCRTTSGYGNANNEKFIAGNRHYWSADIVRNNIISIINNSDYVAIEKAMTKFGLRHPTVAETMQCIKYSTDLYWRTPSWLERIEFLVVKLTPIERSAFVYTGDLYHLAICNSDFVREFLTRLSERIATPLEPAAADAALKAAPEEHRHLAAQICPGEMRLPKGVKVDDIRGTPAHGIYAATAENIGKVLMQYRDLIKAFWVTSNVPASVAHLPTSIRRIAITSDTDSTIFTVQDWVRWHQGDIKFTQPSVAVAATVVFLAAATITHVLALMSANFGIEEKRIHQIAMKNEYAFDVFIPTQVAKHYYALIGCQEGNLFAQHEKEIKGVHLKSSKAPKRIMKQAEEMMLSIMHTVMAGQLVDLELLLKEIADIERSVVDTIRKGSNEYFSFQQIKTPESYSVEDPMRSNYIHYLHWRDVWAEKYGSIELPPYTCIKLSTELDTPTKLKRWMDSFEDRELAVRLAKFLEESGRKNLGTIWLPEPIVATAGIPEEIFRTIDVRRIVGETTRVFYLILESLNYTLPSGTDRLVMDYY